MKRSIVLMCLLSWVIGSTTAIADRSFDVKVLGEGAPVIFIPGLASDGSVWDATVAQLHASYECHVLTLPGFSNVPPLEEKEDFLGTMRVQIHEYIRSEIGRPVIIVGHSLGGFLGLNISLHHDELVQKLVIVDSYPFYSAVMMPEATVETIRPQASMMKDMMLKMPDKDYSNQQRLTMATMIRDSLQQELAFGWSMESDRQTVAQAMYELMTTDLRAELDDVQTPILVLGSWAAGEPYGITPESTLAAFETQYALAKNCQVKVAESGFHFLMWDEPRWLIQEIETFLKNNDG